jgi:hypothetical protein
VGAEPGQRVVQEAGRAFLALVGQQRCEGQARGVVDGDMQVFPAGATLAALAGAIAGDAMSDAVDPTELFDVQVQQLARVLALVANDRRLGVQRPQPAEAEPAQFQPHRRDRQSEAPGDNWTAEPLATQSLDGGGGLGRQAVGAVKWPGAAVA